MRLKISIKKSKVIWWNIKKIPNENKQIQKVIFKIIFTDEQSSLDGKVENISDTIKELNFMLSSKEENAFQNQNATELS